MEKKIDIEEKSFSKKEKEKEIAKRKERKTKPSGAPGRLVSVFLSPCGSLAAGANRDGSCAVCLLFHRK